jgi:hypothetical protein
MADDIFDLDAVAAEGQDEPFRFRFGGEVYEMPPLDLRQAAKLDDTGGSAVDMFRLLLGDEQWQRMEAAEARLTQPMFLELLDRYTKHTGIDLGESPASSRSSRSTAGRSKRISSGTTRSR